VTFKGIANVSESNLLTNLCHSN